MLPYIIRILGIENYGIYGLLNAFVAPMGLIGLGIAPAIVRSIAIGRTKNAHSNPEIWKHVQTGTAVSLCIGGIGSLIIILLGPVIFSSIFPKVTFPAKSLSLCFIFIGFQWICTQVYGTWSAASIGLQKYQYLAIGQTMDNILLTGIGVYALWLGYGLVGYIFASAIARLIMVIYWIIITSRLLGVRALLPHIEFNIAKSGIKFGAWFSAASIGSLLGSELQKYITGMFLGPAAVGIFNVSMRVSSTAHNVNGRIMEVLFPHFSSRINRSVNERFQHLMIITGGSSLLATSVFVTLIIMAFPLLNAWIGPDIARQGATLLQLFSISSLFVSIAGPIYYFLLAEGNSRITAIISLLVGFIIATGSLLLTPHYGLIGIGVSVAISGLCTFIFYIIFLPRGGVFSNRKTPFYATLYGLSPILLPVLLIPFALWLQIESTTLLRLIIICIGLFVSILTIGGISLQLADKTIGLNLSPISVISQPFIKYLQSIIVAN